MANEKQDTQGGAGGGDPSGGNTLRGKPGAGGTGGAGGQGGQP